MWNRVKLLCIVQYTPANAVKYGPEFFYRNGGPTALSGNKYHVASCYLMSNQLCLYAPNNEMNNNNSKFIKFIAAV